MHIKPTDFVLETILTVCITLILYAATSILHAVKCKFCTKTKHGGRIFLWERGDQGMEHNIDATRTTSTRHFTITKRDSFVALLSGIITASLEAIGATIAKAAPEVLSFGETTARGPPSISGAHYIGQNEYLIVDGFPAVEPTQVRFVVKRVTGYKSGGALLNDLLSQRLSTLPELNGRILVMDFASCEFGPLKSYARRT
jgi:hypothetical protein